jgi:hypothetical protein
MCGEGNYHALEPASIVVQRRVRQKKIDRVEDDHHSPVSRTFLKQGFPNNDILPPPGIR